MRSIRTGALITLVASIAASTFGITTAAGAAPAGPPEYIGWSGGTMITAVGGIVTSNYTAASAITTPTLGVTKTNSLANASLQGLIKVGAINTSGKTAAVAGGGQVTSRAQVANVSILNGLITIGAIDTNASTKIVNGAASGSGSTTFLNIKITGVTLPVNIPRNFGVTIPGVASIILNAYNVAPGAQPGTARADAAGLYVSLLKAQGSNPAGTEIFVSPTHAELGIGIASTATPVGGFAYGTQVQAHASTVVNVGSGPSAYNVLPSVGTGGVDKTNSTAGVSLPAVLSAGVVTTTVNGVADAASSAAKASVAVTGLNLFGGLITADVLKGTAQASQLTGKPVVLKETTTLVNLRIAGTVIPVNVSPNTVIHIANLGTVTINAQVSYGNIAAVRLLDIRLSTAAYGLPVGAEVEVGAAAAYVGLI